MTGYSSDVVMRAASLLRRQEPVKRISFPELKVEHSAAIVPGDGPFQVCSTVLMYIIHYKLYTVLY